MAAALVKGTALVRPAGAGQLSRRCWGRLGSAHLISIFSRGAHGAGRTGQPHRTLEAISASWALRPFLALKRKEDPVNRSLSSSPRQERPTGDAGPMSRVRHRKWSDPIKSPITHRLDLQWPRCSVSAGSSCPGGKRGLFLPTSHSEQSARNLPLSNQTTCSCPHRRPATFPRTRLILTFWIREVGAKIVPIAD